MTETGGSLIQHSALTLVWLLEESCNAPIKSQVAIFGLKWGKKIHGKSNKHLLFGLRRLERVRPGSIFLLLLPNLFCWKSKTVCFVEIGVHNAMDSVPSLKSQDVKQLVRETKT